MSILLVLQSLADLRRVVLSDGWFCVVFFKLEVVVPKFQPGQSGNPQGRKKGTYGRSAALMALDRMLARKRNLSLLENSLEYHFKKDPVKFFKTIIMPLLPKETKVDMDGAGVVKWQSLLGGGSDPTLSEGSVGHNVNVNIGPDSSRELIPADSSVADVNVVDVSEA